MTSWDQIEFFTTNGGFIFGTAWPLKTGYNGNPDDNALIADEVGEFDGAGGTLDPISQAMVPEPSSLALMLAGLACLWGVRRISKA